MFFIGLAVAYALVALVGTWKPALGLDLEGGTQITLTADGSVTSENLDQAADIINARVNGSGVSEAEVTTQGNDEIVVQIPGSTNDNLVQTVIRQARLRFRLVAQVSQTTNPQTPLPSSGASPTPGAGVTLPPSTAPSGSDKPKDKSTGKNRPPALLGKDKPNAATKDKPSASPTASTGKVPTPRRRCTTPRRTRRPSPTPSPGWLTRTPSRSPSTTPTRVLRRSRLSTTPPSRS